MTIITIPKQFANEELVIIPKREYEAMKCAQELRVFKEVPMTKSQESAFKRAERNFTQGNFLTLDEFKQKLAPSSGVVSHFLQNLPGIKDGTCC